MYLTISPQYATTRQAIHVNKSLRGKENLWFQNFSTTCILLYHLCFFSTFIIVVYILHGYMHAICSTSNLAHPPFKCQNFSLQNREWDIKFGEAEQAFNLSIKFSFNIMFCLSVCLSHYLRDHLQYFRKVWAQRAWEYCTILCLGMVHISTIKNIF